MVDSKFYFVEVFDDIVMFFFEVLLKSLYFFFDERWFEYGDGGFLEGDVGVVVEVGIVGVDGFDEFFWVEDLSDMLVWEVELFG